MAIKLSVRDSPPQSGVELWLELDSMGDVTLCAKDLSKAEGRSILMTIQKRGDLRLWEGSDIAALGFSVHGNRIRVCDFGGELCHR